MDLLRSNESYVLLSKSKGQNAGWIVVTAGWAFAVTVGIFVTGWVSGAHLNPAVTLALVVVGDVPVSSALSYIAGQCIGAAIGAFLVFLTYKSHWRETENSNFKLSVFCTMPAIRKNRHNIMTEIIGTAMLLMGVLGISDNHNGLTAE